MSEVLSDETPSAGSEEIDAALDELRREAKLRQTVPWFLSTLVHGLVLGAGFFITFIVIRSENEVKPIAVRSNFEDLTLAPVRLPMQVTEVVQPTANSLLSSPTSPSLAPVAGFPELIEEVSDGSAIASPIFVPNANAEQSASFLGVSGSDARRVVYCIDASGSMIRGLPMVLEHLSHSISRLQSSQRFSVVFFQDNDALPMPHFSAMPPATDAHKRETMRWMHEHIIPRGRSNPLRALELALSVDPDVIFLLSENITGAGPFEIEAQSLLSSLEAMNPLRTDGTRTTAIKCIQFLEEDALDVLRTIAESHGGPDGYTFIERDEAGRLMSRHDGMGSQNP